MSTESVTSSWPPPGLTVSDPVGGSGSPPGHRGRGRQVVLGALVGGLVGAMVAAGVFVATDNDETTTRTVTAPAVVSRPSQQIGGEGDIAAIIQKVEPAVVAITVSSGITGAEGAGTGFVITPDGYIVTNNHVVEGARRISVTFTNGDEKAATLVGTEPSADVAVIKVNGTNLPTVELGDSDSVQVGDEVVAIGNALALEGGLSVTRGIISGLHRNVETNTGSFLSGMLQTDAAINPGNSGGPLVNADGQVIGINTAIANPGNSNNVGFAIPISNVKPIIDDLRLGRTPAFLGVATQTVTPALAREQNLGVTQGALVQRVTANSGAERAGIKVGDVIVAINGQPVAEASDVQTLVRENRPGDTVKVTVNRNGETKTLEAELSERPAGS